ncbi:hypothetical protein MHM84_01265 [Halomonas sp. McH1-25]|uniref:hypothetical protein n=1 Tax=unclassified Halomonas TaxID=2609666 RepID=UPI001EF6004D|nr:MULTISPECIES: hypothetical protein [unclassified Halomonas]MCG7598411.1 hypothetical protein [Halomonas sp. McH1-25]MCP1342647.1 hypothetical protein [Halomonas sp. FL8]MCP1361726.1 hypothetical protein [Halomonas sp. BBD45]MCP1365847.1 hypothetical protein [Halomonas sp. BBD48]
MAAFDTTTYLNNKAAQLNKTGYQGRKDWTVGDVQNAFKDSGLSAEQHYAKWGKSEGVSPYTQTASVPQTTVTKEQTSQGQLEQMLSSGSPLMKLSATQGKQQAAQRGLLNSSMAGQAAQGAMIANAAPFAQQDAQTYYNNAQANATRSMQDYMSDKQYEQQLGLNQQQYEFDTGKLAQQFSYNSQLSSQEANQALNNLYATSTANAWGVMANNLTDLVGQSASAIQQIQMNPDITADNKATMIQQILDMRNTDIEFQQSLYENLGTYLANTGVFPNLA